MRELRDCIKSVVEFDFANATEKEIEEVLPTFGMNDEYTDEIPERFREYMGWGIKLWQYPNQFSKLLTFLKNKRIGSYLEIGVRYGGSFIVINELLKRYNGYVESHCIDVIAPSDILHTYQHDFVRERFYYHQMESQSPHIFQILANFEYDRLSKKIDLIFIDGCHSYTCVKQDYHACLMFGPKYLIFHDIVNHHTSGTRLAWNEIKKNHKKTYEFLDQYDGMKNKFLGIGVVEITPEDNIFPMFSPHFSY